MLATRARDNVAFVALVNAVGGQDELVFDGHSVVLDDDGEVLARAPGFEEALLVVDIEPSVAIARRLRDVRRRALARDRGEPLDLPVIHVGAPRPSTNGKPAEPQLAPLLDELEQMRLALELALARLRGEERLQRRRRRRVRRDRLSADGRAGGRGARPRACALRVDAFALLVRAHARRRAQAGREPRRRLPRAADRADGGGVRGDPRREASPGSTATSPRRTSRPGSAAFC